MIGAAEMREYEEAREQAKREHEQAKEILGTNCRQELARSRRTGEYSVSVTVEQT
jgi:hypothetical protein